MTENTTTHPPCAPGPCHDDRHTAPGGLAAAHGSARTDVSFEALKPAWELKQRRKYALTRRILGGLHREGRVRLFAPDGTEYAPGAVSNRTPIYFVGADEPGIHTLMCDNAERVLGERRLRGMEVERLAAEQAERYSQAEESHSKRAEAQRKAEERQQAEEAERRSEQYRVEAVRRSSEFGWSLKAAAGWLGLSQRDFRTLFPHERPAHPVGVSSFDGGEYVRLANGHTRYRPSDIQALRTGHADRISGHVEARRRFGLLLTTAQVADRFGCRPDEFRRLAAVQGLEPEQAVVCSYGGRRHLWPPELLDEYLFCRAASGGVWMIER